jgi:hypothetical protein
MVMDEPMKEPGVKLTFTFPYHDRAYREEALALLDASEMLSAIHEVSEFLHRRERGKDAGIHKSGEEEFKHIKDFVDEAFSRFTCRRFT